MSSQSLKKTITNPLPIILALSTLRVIRPLWALLVGSLTVGDDTYTITGLLLFAVIPTGINSVVWAAMHKGNISLSLSVILIDTLLAPLIIPFTLFLLTGASVEMETTSLMIGLIQMIVIPSLLGMIVNELTNGEFPKVWSPKLAPFSKIGLIIVVVINGATVAPYFTTIDLKLISIMVTVFFLAVSGFAFSWLLAKCTKMKREETVAIIYSGGMRNISTGIVIAVSYFPSQAAIPVITGILFQQVISAAVGGLLNRGARKESIGKSSYVFGK